MAEQFLTLMAVLDDESQKTMTRWYDELRAAAFHAIRADVKIRKNTKYYRIIPIVLGISFCFVNPLTIALIFQYCCFMNTAL